MYKKDENLLCGALLRGIAQGFVGLVDAAFPRGLVHHAAEEMALVRAFIE
jgi:hypothetical protein